MVRGARDIEPRSTPIDANALHNGALRDAAATWASSRIARLSAHWAYQSLGPSAARTERKSIRRAPQTFFSTTRLTDEREAARLRGPPPAHRVGGSAFKLTRRGAPRKFTGKEEDAEVGLTYFGKRFLNAQLGRWISADPLAVHAPGQADLNLYAYVSGTVLKNIDPLGLEEEAPGAGGASGAGPSGAEGAPSGPEPDELSYLDACADGGCVNAAPDQAASPASPTPAPVNPSIPRLPQGPFAKARDQLIQQAQKSDNGLEKATGYTLAGFMAGPASVEDGLRAVPNAPSNAEEAGQHWARAAEFEAQGEDGEALVEKLKAVESFADAFSAGLATASFAASRGGGWPDDDGFLGPTRQKELAPGTLVDRYGGGERSVFFAPAGTPLEARALRLEGRLEPLRTFEVVAPLRVRAGLSVPWFGQIGLGTQYRSQVTLKELIDAEILREITK
jgi:RHS repeat-associated protein